MPEIGNYGIAAEVRMAANIDGRLVFLQLPESNSNCIWKSANGLIHPIFVTTIETPVQVVGTQQIPMKLVVDFKDPVDLPDYMKGDMRVELMVDGVMAGIKYFREFKVKGTGFHLEFGGYRVGRTEERAFVFNPLPNINMSDVPGEATNGGAIANRGLNWVLEAMARDTALDQMTGEVYVRGALDPPRPVGLPPGVSVLQLLVTVGRKYRTLEKYFMAGAIQSTAFYYAPRPPTSLALDPKNWQPPVGSDGIPQTSNTAKKVTGGVARLTISGGQTLQDGLSDNQEHAVETTGELVLEASKEHAAWRPVGLTSEVTKTVQSKEVEFAARLHLVRFWVFVVTPGLTPSILDYPDPTRSLVVVLKASSSGLKKILASSPPHHTKIEQNIEVEENNRLVVVNGPVQTLPALVDATTVDGSPPSELPELPVSPIRRANASEGSSKTSGNRGSHRKRRVSESRWFGGRSSKKTRQR